MCLKVKKRWDIHSINISPVSFREGVFCILSISVVATHLHYALNHETERVPLGASRNTARHPFVSDAKHRPSYCLVHTYQIWKRCLQAKKCCFRKCQVRAAYYIYHVTLKAHTRYDSYSAMQMQRPYDAARPTTLIRQIVGLSVLVCPSFLRSRNCFMASMQLNM